MAPKQRTLGVGLTLSPAPSSLSSAARSTPLSTTPGVRGVTGLAACASRAFLADFLDILLDSVVYTLRADSLAGGGNEILITVCSV